MKALVTGGAGFIGSHLVDALVERGDQVMVIDNLSSGRRENLATPAGEQAELVEADVTDVTTVAETVERQRPELVFHLAAQIDVRRSVTDPVYDLTVNVGGTLNLLEFAQAQSSSHGRPVVFMYPSSIAVYGLTRETKIAAGKVREDQFTDSTTMYGCNKLYCEQLGRYYARHYKQLSAEHTGQVDFRGVRFPGLISAVTVPSGGTSDFAPEMIHAAAKGEPYACFVRPDTRIPFMAMPDGVDALIQLARAPRESLTLTSYNLGAFAPSAEEVEHEVRRAFPTAEISYAVDTKRQGIVDSWPADVDDAAARADWGFAPKYDFTRAFRDYLIPTIKERYAK
jgi:nucleoside-diphosphate-sugar epimerase